MCFNSQSFGDLTIAEDFDTAIFHLFYFAAFYEAFWSNNSACFKCIQGRNIDGGESGFELCVAETTFWETTLDPERRLLKLVEIEDARMASSVTEMLMGTEVPPRRAFIYENATEAELDV